MSIATMMALNIERQRQPIATAAAASGGEPIIEKTPGSGPGVTAPQKTLDSAMEKITAFIPSEVIGSYVAVLGIISPETDVGKWVIFFICLLLIPVFMLLGYWTKKKQAKAGQSTPTSKRDTAILMLLAAVAFVAWAMALPGTPFLALNARATAIGGAFVIIITLIIYKVADLFDLVPKP